jgi:voltage-gated potassium channel
MTYEKIKRKVYEIIRGDQENYISSRVFEIFIVSIIIINVILVFLDTFSGFPQETKSIFSHIELVSIVIFSIEYLLRIWTANYIYPELNPAKARIRYLVSFMAIVDLLAVLPFYIPFIIPVDLRVLRVIRLFRIVRILKINHYTKALSNVGKVLKAKGVQLISSFFVVLILMVIASVLMFNIENEAQPTVFENAFSGLWWAVATFTTVGYGDIYPITVLGKILSSVISILGIGLVAVPTGIISAGFVEQMEEERLENCKEKCYCPYCGEKIN